MTEKAPRRVGLYIRLSSENGPESENMSIKAQGERLREECAKNGDIIVFEYTDYAKTGREDRKRHGYRAMMKRRHEVDAIMAIRLDRFHRSLSNFTKMTTILQEAKVDLIVLNMNLDTSTAQGRLFIDLIVRFGQYLAEMLSEDIRTNYQHRMKTTNQTSGIAPFGYERINKNLVPIPAIATVFAAAYQAFLNSKDIKMATHVLNASKFPPKGVAAWTPPLVRQMFANPIYAGFRVYDDVPVARCEAIISFEDYVEGNKIMDVLSARVGKVPSVRRAKRAQRIEEFLAANSDAVDDGDDDGEALDS